MADITVDEAHVLLDALNALTAPLIEENVRSYDAGGDDPLESVGGYITIIASAKAKLSAIAEAA